MRGLIAVVALLTASSAFAHHRIEKTLSLVTRGKVLTVALEVGAEQLQVCDPNSDGRLTPAEIAGERDCLVARVRALGMVEADGLKALPTSVIVRAVSPRGGRSVFATLKFRWPAPPEAVRVRLDYSGSAQAYAVRIADRDAGKERRTHLAAGSSALYALR